MKTASSLNRFRRASIVAFLVLLSLPVWVVVSRADNNSFDKEMRVERVKQPNGHEGIALTESLNSTDVAYLQTNLQFLQTHLPAWFDYVAQTNPFTLSVDLSAGEQGFAAYSTCCDERGWGEITWGAHLGELRAFDTEEEQTPEARQIEFLDTLIHEATHIRDHRAGRIPAELTFRACLAAETSAYSKELEFNRALTGVNLNSHPISSSVYQRILEKRIQVALDGPPGGFRSLYCIIYSRMEE